MRYRIEENRLTSHALVRLVLAATMGLVLALLFLMSAERAAAQNAAAPSYGLSRAAIADQLRRRYNEAPVAGGITSNGQLLEIFAAPDGRSWTIVATRQDGTSTVIADGEAWSFLVEAKGLPI